MKVASVLQLDYTTFARFVRLSRVPTTLMQVLVSPPADCNFIFNCNFFGDYCCVYQIFALTLQHIKLIFTILHLHLAVFRSCYYSCSGTEARFNGDLEPKIIY